MFMVLSYIIPTYATYEGPNVSLVKHINYTDNEHFTSVRGLPQILDHPWPRIHRVHQKLRQVPILLFVSSGCRVVFQFQNYQSNSLYKFALLWGEAQKK